MRLSAVFTDLDGTVLEPDGSLVHAAVSAGEALGEAGVPLVLLTSKTADELRQWLSRLDAVAGSFENGAGLLGPWGVEVLPGAVPVELLRAELDRVARETGLRPKTLESLSLAEALEATGLPPEALPAALARRFDLPFLAPEGCAPLLESAVGKRAGLALTRGGRFWHLCGRHDKADAFRALKARLDLSGRVAGLGDAPNDAGFLSLCDVAIAVPPPGAGPSPLAGRLASLRLAPAPGGEGWAAAVLGLLEEVEP